MINPTIQQELVGKVRNLKMMVTVKTEQKKESLRYKTKEANKPCLKPRFSNFEPIDLNGPFKKKSKQIKRNTCRLARVDSTFIQTLREINKETVLKEDEKISASENTKESMHINEGNQIDSTSCLNPTTQPQTYKEAIQKSCQLNLKPDKNKKQNLRLLSCEDLW